MEILHHQIKCCDERCDDSWFCKNNFEQKIHQCETRTQNFEFTKACTVSIFGFFHHNEEIIFNVNKARLHINKT